MSLTVSVSEKNLHSLFEAMSNGIATYSSTDGQNFFCTGMNSAAEKITGVTFRDISGRELREVFPGVVEMGLYTVFKRVWASGTAESLPGAYYQDQHNSRYHENRVYKISGTEIAAVFNDVTEQKNALLELKRREEQLRVLFETSRAGIILVDPAGVITVANTRMAEMFGCTMEEMIGSRYPDHVHPDQHTSGDNRMRRLIAGEIDHVATERHYIRKDGSDFWGFLTGRRLVDSAGTLLNLVGHINDITELKQKEILLSASEKKFRMLFEHSADPSLLMVDNTFVDCNQATVEILGAGSKEEVLNTHPSVLSPEYQPDGRLSAEKADEMIASAVQNGSHRFEWAHRRVNGEIFPVEVSLTLIQEAGQTIIFTVWRDITERKQSEYALLEEKNKSDAIIAALGDGLSIQDRNYRILFQNEIHKGFVGSHVGELCFKAYEKRDEVCASCPIDATFRDGGIHSTLRSVEMDGGISYFEITSSPLRDSSGCIIAGIELVRDITDRKRAEEEHRNMEHKLLHTQKLESLGVLAGGIAHDFNNILTTIIGNADLALMRLNPESPAVGNLHSIEQAAARAADLAKQMLAYSGKGRFVVESLDLNILLEEMLHMLEVSISKKAVLRLNLHTPLPPVEADATQMRQIVMNLVINASEAIGDRSGVIAITTGCMDCDASYLKDVWLDENLTAGLYDYLEIADSGCGMDRETMAKLFDPFFTTKFTGRGLGMAAVLGIVRGHKGAIKVYSEPGKGTSFKILLPASGRPAGIFNGEPRRDDWRGSGTVLLVDDEETIRGIGAEMLKELGFTTVTAVDGRDAVEKFRSSPDISFVILDLTMPHMDGEQCFRELRQIKPDVKVIMSSGYNEQEVTQKFTGKGLAGFIQKPYRLSALKETIKGIM